MSAVRSSVSKTRVGVLLLLAIAACPRTWAQRPPPAAGAIWQPPQTQRYEQQLRRVPPSRPTIDSNKVYSLTELVDWAEQHNPETRIAWERAKAAVAQVGVAHSSLYPEVSALVLLHQSRDGVLFGDSFYLQDIGLMRPAVELVYTVLDFGRRRARIDIAKEKALAADFTFNDVHERIIFDVTSAYYQVLSAQGQVGANEATLTNAQTVQQAVEERLKNGLATLPDVLEARAATAQADYDLETARGAERVAQGLLAEALGTSPTVALKVEQTTATMTAEALREPVKDAIERALEQRPDLLAQAAQVRAAAAAVREARDDYFPTVKLNGFDGYEWAKGSQLGSPGPAEARAQLWDGELHFAWRIFDGHERYNELDRARSEQRQAQAELSSLRDTAETQVWTAYSNVETAIRQQDAAAALLIASDKSYQAVLEAYKYGVKNFLDVVSAQRTLALARTGQVVARSRLFTSVTDLAFRTGDLVRTRTAAGKH
jgi:outer membrane protein